MQRTAGPYMWVSSDRVRQSEKSTHVRYGRNSDREPATAEATAGLTITTLILKRGSASRPFGDWNDDDFDVLADGAVADRILKVHAAPVRTPWMWALAFGHHEDRRPTQGFAATREAAMAAFAKSWRRG